MATLWFGRDSSMSQAWMSETCVLKTSAWKSTWPTSHVWLSMLYTTTSCVWIWAPWGNLAALATWASDGLELRNPAMVLSSVAFAFLALMNWMPAGKRLGSFNACSSSGTMACMRWSSNSLVFCSFVACVLMVLCFLSAAKHEGR